VLTKVVEIVDINEASGSGSSDTPTKNLPPLISGDINALSGLDSIELARQEFFSGDSDPVAVSSDDDIDDWLQKIFDNSTDEPPKPCIEDRGLSVVALIGGFPALWRASRQQSRLQRVPKVHSQCRICSHTHADHRFAHGC
jgi:hypothetical protein